MVHYLEFIQFRAPAGTSDALRALAATEAKRPAELMREALLARLGSGPARSNVEAVR